MALSISDVTPRVSYSVGSSSTGPFTYPFPIFSDEDLKVYVDGGLPTLTSHYTVSGAGSANGGTITLVNAVANVILAIVRDIPIARTTDFPTAGPLRIEALNTQLAKLTAIDQQLDTRLDRSIRLQDSDTDMSMVLPSAAARANRFLAFGATGEPTVEAALSVTGGEGDLSFSSGTALAATNTGGTAAYIWVAGFRYRLISTPSPVKAWHKVSADGYYYQYDEPVLYGAALGIVADNSTDNTSALAATREAIEAGLWKSLRLPNGVTRFNGWDLSDLNNFTVESDGGTDLTHGRTGGVPCHTGSGSGNGINARNSTGLTFRNIAITYSSSTFTGILMNISCTNSVWNKHKFENVHFYKIGAAVYDATLI